MKLRVLVPTLAALLVVGGCSSKKKEGEKASPAKPGETQNTGGASATGGKAAPGKAAPGKAAPLDVTKSDKLWALAPADTVLGMVAAPGAASQLHSMLMGVGAVVGARPMGAEVLAKLKEESKNESVDIFDPASIRAAGIDLNGAAALFMVDQDQGYMILPVTDRAAFRKVTEAKQETVDGLEVDRLEDDLVCASIADRYLCGHTPESLKTFGTPVNGSLAKRVAALPNEYRGQLEFVLDVPSMGKVDPDFTTDFDGQFTNPELGIASLRLGNGALTLRGWFQAKPADKVAAAAAVSTNLSTSIAAANPSSLMSIRVPVSAIADTMPNPEKQLAGLDLKKDVMGNLTGEIVGYTPQSAALWGRLAVGIAKAAPFKTLLNMGCGMAPALGVPGITITPADGKCSAIVDVAKLPLPDKSMAEAFSEPISVVAEVKADRIEVTVGKEAPTTNNPVSAMGQELLGKPWSFSMWAEGMSLASGAALPWNNMPAEVPAEFAEGIKVGVWVISHVYEVGIAGAVRDDGIHGVFHVGTYAGDAPEAYAAYQAAITKTLDTGKAVAEFEAIRAKWPNSMAARGGTGAGSMMIAGVTGALAAVAIPAFMKYQQKSAEAVEAIGTFEQGTDAQRAP